MLIGSNNKLSIGRIRLKSTVITILATSKVTQLRILTVGNNQARSSKTNAVRIIGRNIVPL